VTQAQVQSEYGSRGWVVVGAAFVTMALLYGLWYSYSVFLVALLKEFGWSRSVTAGPSLCSPWCTQASVPSSDLSQSGLVTPNHLCGWMCAGARAAADRRDVAALAPLPGVWLHRRDRIGFSGYVPLVILIRGWFPTRIGTAAASQPPGSAWESPR